VKLDKRTEEDAMKAAGGSWANKEAFYGGWEAASEYWRLRVFLPEFKAVANMVKECREENQS